MEGERERERDKTRLITVRPFLYSEEIRDVVLSSSKIHISLHSGEKKKGPFPPAPQKARYHLTNKIHTYEEKRPNRTKQGKKTKRGGKKGEGKARMPPKKKKKRSVIFPTPVPNMHIYPPLPLISPARSKL